MSSTESAEGKSNCCDKINSISPKVRTSRKGTETLQSNDEAINHFHSIDVQGHISQSTDSHPV